jgi:DNA-binding MarR family transcriptional regulator
VKNELPARGPGWAAFGLAQVGGLATQRFAERLAPTGLTPAHAGLLRAVAADEGRSQQAVASQLGLLPSRMVALVDELERDGLLERHRNPKDRRHYALHLTDAGRTRMREIGRVAREHGAELLAPLDDDERVMLGDLLARLAAHHGLTPGVHPGYRTLGRSDSGGGRGQDAG